jgi:hypothetical protein
MNKKGGALHLYLCAGALCLAALQSSLCFAADPVNLEGTWKIAAAQSSFRPEGGSVPFTEQGRKQYQENKRKQAKRDYDAYDIATARCASPGVPRLMLTPDRFRIWQRTGLTMFQFEWNRLLRQIEMPGLLKLQMPAMPGGFGGDPAALIGRAIPVAKGQWQGDTLVVNTEGFDENTLIDNLVPHGDQLKLTERLRLRDSDTLEDRITIEDPDFFTRPWEATVNYKRQPDAAFPENVCLDRLAAGKPTL